jgi:hypothetical protein
VIFCSSVTHAPGSDSYVLMRRSSPAAPWPKNGRTCGGIAFTTQAEAMRSGKIRVEIMIVSIVS